MNNDNEFEEAMHEIRRLLLEETDTFRDSLESQFEATSSWSEFDPVRDTYIDVMQRWEWRTHPVDVEHIPTARCLDCGTIGQFTDDDICECNTDPSHRIDNTRRREVFDVIRKGIHDKDIDGQLETSTKKTDEEVYFEYYGRIPMTTKVISPTKKVVKSNNSKALRLQLSHGLSPAEQKSWFRFPIGMRKTMERLGIGSEPTAWSNFGRVYSATQSSDCPICPAVMSASATAVSLDGFVLRRLIERGSGNPDRPTFDWSSVVYCGTSAGYNYMAKKFKPFGRVLRLLYDGITPTHSLDRCELIYLSDLVTDLRCLTDKQQKEPSLLPKPRPTGQTIVQLKGTAERHFKMPTIPISQYVGVAVVMPKRVKRSRIDVGKFWHWKLNLDGTQSDVIKRVTTRWRGICLHCLVAMSDKDSLSKALVNTGSPDPMLRLNPDYYDDLLEQVIEAHTSQTFTVFVMEPVLNF